jgi:LacI family transcriptional regulator of maltose regulon
MRDNRQAASLAVRYLIERGHRNIAYIGGRKAALSASSACSAFAARWRKTGWSGAMNTLPPAAMTPWQPVCHPPAAGKNNTITALLCHSPDAMIGSISGIHQVGRTVGKDVFLTQQVALVGFEDMLHVNLTSPSFTYVSSASEETGRQAAGLIIRTLKEPTLQRAYRTRVGVKSEFRTAPAIFP